MTSPDEKIHALIREADRQRELSAMHDASGAGDAANAALDQAEAAAAEARRRTTRWAGPSGLEVERLADFGSHSGSGWSVGVATPGCEDPLLLTPEQWADLVSATFALGEQFGEMP